MLRTGALILSIGMLASGCGGSAINGGVAGNGGGDFDIPSYANVIALVDANARAIERAGELGLTASNDVPTSGSATFAGPILIVDQDSGSLDATISGGMEIDVTFANVGSITGAAGNFFDSDGTPVDGTLTLSAPVAADLDNGEGFEAQLKGQVNSVGRGTNTADFVYDIELTQTYVGPDVQILFGAGSGAAAPIGDGEATSVSVSAISERR